MNWLCRVNHDRFNHNNISYLSFILASVKNVFFDTIISQVLFTTSEHFVIPSEKNLKKGLLKNFQFHKFFRTFYLLNGNRGNLHDTTSQVEWVRLVHPVTLTRLKFWNLVLVCIPDTNDGREIIVIFWASHSRVKVRNAIRVRTYNPLDWSGTFCWKSWVAWCVKGSGCGLVKCWRWPVPRVAFSSGCQTFT